MLYRMSSLSHEGIKVYNFVSLFLVFIYCTFCFESKFLMLRFISERVLICGFELFIEEFFKIPMEKMTGKTLPGTKSAENRGGHSCTVQSVHLMQHCVAECKSYYMRPFHQRLLPIEVHLPPFLAHSLSLFLVLFLGVSLRFSGLAAAESVKCCSLWGLSPTGSRSKL